MVPCGKRGPCMPPSGQIEERFLTSLLVKILSSIQLTLNTNCRPYIGVGAQSKKYSK